MDENWKEAFIECGMEVSGRREKGKSTYLLASWLPTQAIWVHFEATLYPVIHSYLLESSVSFSFHSFMYL